MKILEYLEIENLKCFGEKQRIYLDHPAVLIGPNNCGKTTVLQAIALWSQAVKEWHRIKGNSPPKKRTSTSLNRLKILSVPVQKIRYFWHNANVRAANRDIPLVITIGMVYKNHVEPVKIQFRSYGDDLIYCTPDHETLKHPELIEAAAHLTVDLLYPLSGLEMEEAILQPGRINVLLGQGQTGQVLRNLCLFVHDNQNQGWMRIVHWMERLFSVQLQNPQRTSRGSIDLYYRQSDIKEPLDISLAGRGQQQLLLILAYLYSHPKSVFLIDEPDAHLEILRQRQVYVLLRDIAAENSSQVILVTHSEVILQEALDRNLTVLIEAKVDTQTERKTVRNALKHFGAEHYVRARQCGYVLYLEGSTDLDILCAFAHHLHHPVAKFLDERVNAYYVQSNVPVATLESEIERVEGGYGLKPREHFFSIRSVMTELVGLAILDSDGRNREDLTEGGLKISYWKRYECENYFITPDLLRDFALEKYPKNPLLQRIIPPALDQLILTHIFQENSREFKIWKNLNSDASILLWESKTKNIKLSDFAVEFFRRISEDSGQQILLRKTDLYQLVQFSEAEIIPEEVTEKLDNLLKILSRPVPRQLQR